MFRKNVYKTLGTLCVVFLALFTVVGCKGTSKKQSSAFVNDEYKELGIKKYRYGKKFKMGKNLREGISQYMSYNDDYNDESMNDKLWEVDFVRSLISSARGDFDYIDSLVKTRENDFISKEEAEYIHYSFTGKSIHLKSEEVENGMHGFSVYKCSDIGVVPVERITSYRVISEKDDLVNLVAKYNCYGENSEGNKPYKKGEYRICLEKNPYSCFDGYSIRKIKRQNVKYTAQLDKIYKVKCSYDEDINKYTVYYSPDEIEVVKNAVVDFGIDKKLDDYVRKYKGARFEVGFKLKKHEDHIKEIKPISVKVIEE